MEASGLSVYGQGKKLCKGKRKNAKDGKDRLTNLPETLLSHILSFLPTKDAVQSSVLSKRWKYVWTFVTNLHFEDRFFPRCGRKSRMANFMNFVERVLLHHGNSTINDFHLSCQYDCDASRINAWISAVIRRKVKRLHIEYYGTTFVFPGCLFTCDSLTEMNLTMGDFFTLKVPASVSLPSLKILRLCGITLLNGYSSASKELNFSFPILEVLELSTCRWSKVKTVNIEAPLLATLKLEYYRLETGLGSPDDVWEDYVLGDLVLLNPSSICEAAFIIGLLRDPNLKRKVGNRAGRFLKQMSCAQFLTLSNHTIETLAFAESSKAILPTYDKLINLRLYNSVVVSRTLMDLIRSSPVLESLIFSEGISQWVKDDIVHDALPPCFQSHLKVVGIKIISGKEHELDFVKYILDNAAVLDEMIMTFDEWNWNRKSNKKKIKKQLLAYPKGSSSATINFS